MASIETYCKLCTYNGKQTPPQQEYKVNGRYLYNPIKEGQSYAFDRIWDKNSSYNDINSIFSSGSRSKFYEGYNNTFVIKGTSKNIIQLINIKQSKKHENIFLHLVESLCEEWTRKVKMKKKSNNRQSQSIPEDQLHMSIYEVTQQVLVDLISNKNLCRSSQLGKVIPFIYMTICFILKNLQKQRFADVILKGVPKNFANSTGKHLCWSLFLVKLFFNGVSFFRIPWQFYKIKICYKTFQII